MYSIFYDKELKYSNKLRSENYDLKEKVRRLGKELQELQQNRNLEKKRLAIINDDVLYP